MKFSFLKRQILILLGLMVLTCSAVLAQENRISSVAISKSKDILNGYELTIDSTENVAYKTKVVNDNNIIFELKNSVLEDDLGTFYNDANEIDSVTVKQNGNNRVRIYVQGENVKNTELIFVNSLFEADNKSQKKITLNQPLNQYQPTNNLNDDEGQDWNDNSFNMSQLTSSIFSSLKEGSMGLILIILAIIALGAFVIKTIANKQKEENEPLIGLNNSYGTQINLNQNKKSIQSDVLAKRSETIRAAQEELQKAHQKYQAYMQNKYKDSYKEKMNSIDIDAVKQGLALNQYKKSTQNPYKDQKVLKMREDFSQRETLQDNFKIPPRPKKVNQEAFTSPYIRRQNPALNQKYAQNNLKSGINEPISAPKKRVSSMNFLESVTKIYEQSGRADLANDLKNKMIKAKQ